MSTLARKDTEGRIIAWECIGCGKVEAPQPCIGVCQDRKTEFVYADDYDRAVEELRQTQDALTALRALARQMAHTRPREGQWEQALRHFQVRAADILSNLK